MKNFRWRNGLQLQEKQFSARWAPCCVYKFDQLEYFLWHMRCDLTSVTLTTTRDWHGSGVTLGSLSTNPYPLPQQTRELGYDSEYPRVRRFSYYAWVVCSLGKNVHYYIRLPGQLSTIKSPASIRAAEG
jgi:hypothetical protein